MRIRELKPEDALRMLEWMHDPDVVKDLRADFASKTIEDCFQFIENSQDMTESLHLAIVDNNDEYMGTVSLKHISSGTAEFGITVRACAMRKGYSQFGMRSIIEKGFSELGLSEIFWCVSPINERALRFYDKHGYERYNGPEASLFYSAEEIREMVWYHVVPAHR